MTTAAPIRPVNRLDHLADDIDLAQDNVAAVWDVLSAMIYTNAFFTVDERRAMMEATSHLEGVMPLLDTVRESLERRAAN